MNKILLVCLILTYSLVLGAQEVTIHVDDNYRPYSYKDVSGKAAGVYIEVLEAVFKNMEKFTVKLSPVPWSRGKALMEKGEGFGLAPAFFHGHDWPYLYPYSLHFFEERIVAVCREGVTPLIRSKWPNDFRGLHFVNMKGFDGWGGDEFRKMIKENKIEYSELNGVLKTIQLVALKRADCLLAEEGSFDALYRNMLRSSHLNPKTTEALVKTVTVGVDPVYIGFSKPGIEKGNFPYHYEFKRQFDIQFYLLKKSGYVQKLMQESYGRHLVFD